MIYVVTANSSTKKNDFGGTPQRLTQGFFENGVEARGLDLVNSWTYLFSIMWRIWRIITLRKATGWQFSKLALRLRSYNLDRQITNLDIVISFFPLIKSKKCPVLIYTDITLKSLFQTYPETFRVSSDIKLSSIKTETEIYNQSDFVLVASLECKNELIENYGILNTKVIFLPLAPNIVPKIVDAKVLSARIASLASHFNILFIGKDSHRKGLDRVFQLRDYLLSNGINVELHIVGLDTPHPFTDLNPKGSRYYGFQSNDSDLFLELLEKSHLGVLLSRSEATGIALLEFQAAGLPTLISGVGGMNSFVFSRTVKIVEIDRIEEQAQIIANSVRDESYQVSLSLGIDESHKIPNWKKVAADVLKLCQ